MLLQLQRKQLSICPWLRSRPVPLSHQPLLYPSSSFVIEVFQVAVSRIHFQPSHFLWACYQHALHYTRPVHLSRFAYNTFLIFSLFSSLSRSVCLHFSCHFIVDHVSQTQLTHTFGMILHVYSIYVDFHDSILELN